MNVKLNNSVLYYEPLVGTNTAIPSDSSIKKQSSLDNKIQDFLKKQFKGVGHIEEIQITNDTINYVEKGTGKFNVINLDNRQQKTVKSIGLLSKLENSTQRHKGTKTQRYKLSPSLCLSVFVSLCLINIKHNE